MAFEGNPARYTVNGLPSQDVNGNRGVVVANNTPITLQLEVIPSGVQSARFQVFDPADPTSPLASLEAPQILFDDSGTAAQLLTDPDTQTATFTMPNFGTIPSSDIYAYLVRCTISQAGGPEVFERTIVTRGVNTDLRKTFPAESAEMEARGWSDELNRMVDVVESLISGGGGGYNTMQEEGAPLTQRPTMNFIGDGVTATDDAGNSRTNVTIASGLQEQYALTNTVDVTAARPVLLRAVAGVASPLEVQVDASPVLLVNADGKIALTSTSGQDIDIVVAGGSDVISITGGDVDIDASTGELGLDDQGNWGGTLSQVSDRTLDLTGGGELYENITSILGALNAVGNAVGSGGSLQSAYVGGQSVAMAAATGNVVWNATDGVAFQIQKGATNVFEMDIAGRVLIDPTSGQDFILNTLGTGDVSINTLGTGALNLNGAVNVNVDAAGGELTLDDVGNWGGTLSQTGDRTLTLTGAGELYNGVTSVLGGLNAAAQSMQETYNIAGLLSLDVDGGNPLKFDSATPHFLGAGLFQIARNTGSNEATVLIAPDTPADSGNAGTTLVLFAANGSDQTTGGTGQSGTDAGGLQFGTLPAGFGSAASGAGAAAGPGGNAVGVVIGLAAGGTGGAGSGSDAAGQGGEGPSFLIDGTSGNGGVGGAGTASVPGANGGTGGAFNLFMGGAGAGGAGSATQAAGDGGNAQDFTVALGAGGAAGAANGGAGGDGGDAASFVLSTALGGVGSGGGTTGQSGHIDWVPALGANPGAVRILNRSPLRFHGPGLGTYTAIRQNADPAAIGELRLPVTLPTDDQILAATTGGATAQLEWVTPSGGGGGGLVFTAVQTAAYTAVADDLVLADPVTTGDFPVHSPASPTKDDKFGVKKSVAGGVVTVDFATTGGSTVDGGQTSLTVSANYGARIFQYNGTEWSEVPS